MLYRKYGNSLHTVVPHFDHRALSEISYRRDRVASLPLTELEEAYEKVREAKIEGKTEGPVQSEAEAALTKQLESQVQSLLDGLQDDELLVVENVQGVDYPKLRDRKEGIIVEGENRLYFHWSVDPPIRLGLYRRRAP